MSVLVHVDHSQLIDTYSYTHMFVFISATSSPPLSPSGVTVVPDGMCSLTSVSVTWEVRELVIFNTEVHIHVSMMFYPSI